MSDANDGYKTPPGSPIKKPKPCPGAPGRGSFPSLDISNAFALIMIEEPTTPIKDNEANCPNAPRKRKIPRTTIKSKKAKCPSAPRKRKIPRTPIKSKKAKCPNAPRKRKIPRTPV